MITTTLVAVTDVPQNNTVSQAKSTFSQGAEMRLALCLRKDLIYRLCKTASEDLVSRGKGYREPVSQGRVVADIGDGFQVVCQKLLLCLVTTTITDPSTSYRY